jgi:spore germination protein GerM
MKRILCAIAMLSITGAACASGPEVHQINLRDLPKALYTPGPNTSGSLRMAHVSVYLVRTDSNGRPLSPPHLGAVKRSARTDLSPAEFAMRALLRGPTPEELPRYRTALPPGTELLGVTTRNRVAVVNLSAQFEAAGAEVLHLLRIAQVVWTLTDLPSVDAVQFRIHGAPQPVIDQNGISHDLVGQARYSRFAPGEPGEGAPDVGGDVAPDQP